MNTKQVLLVQIILQFTMMCCSSSPLVFSQAKIVLQYQEPELLSININSFLVNPTSSNILPETSSLQQLTQGQLAFRNAESVKSRFSITNNSTERIISFQDHNQNAIKETLWRVLTANQSKKLENGAFLRIGITQLHVYDTSIPFVKKKLLEGQTKPKKQRCRYCFGQNSTTIDPLICLCKCTGTIKFTHLSCLQEWLLSKCPSCLYVKLQQSSFRKIVCELCKGELPINFQYKKVDYRLFEFLKAQQESSEHAQIVLRLNNLNQNHHEIISFIVAKFEQKLKIGSDPFEADIMMEMVGIAPIHCQILLANNNFYVSDSKSRLGTLINCCEEQFNSKEGIMLQYDKYLLQIKSQTQLFSCLESNLSYKLNVKNHKRKIILSE